MKGWLDRLSPPLLLAGAATGIALLALALRLWPDARSSHPEQDGRLEVAGLEAPLELLRDRRGVPHVEARSEADAYFGLGYAHAQDRPAQMEWLRRLARGRLAEITGEAGLAADRRARLLGIARHAEATWERMPLRSRGLVEAYAAGVNARFGPLARGELAAPASIAAWEIELEPWRPADSLAIAKLVAWGLGGALEESLVLSDLIERLGAVEARLFFPRGAGAAGLAADPPPGSGSPIWETTRRDTRWDPGDPPARASAGARATPPPVGAGPPGSAAPRDWLPLRRRLGLLGASAGSSAWLVGGQHSESGGVLLAADAHFAPTVPAAWYQAHLRGGNLDVAGAGVPGLPVFWTGFNRRVAWASVHAGVVVTDLYVESLHPGDPSRYHDGRRWRSLRERREEIGVRGGRPHTLVVRETRHGPLVNPLLDREREPLALRWTGADGSRGLDAMLRVARAVSAPELRRALADHHEPVLAFLYADFAGEAGMQLAGSVPRRPQAASLLPAPGRDSAFDWEGRVPFESLPARQLEAGEGSLVASDDRLSGSVEEPLEWLWHPERRSARAAVLLDEATARGGLDLRALAALQLDAYSQGAEPLLAAALDAADPAALSEPAAAEAVAILRAWDFEAGPDSAGAAVYHLFLDRLVRELFEPVLGQALLERYLGLGRVDPTRLAEEVLAGGGGPFGEALGERVGRSLRELGYRLPVALGVNREKWRWGSLHALRFQPLYGPGAPDALGPFAFGGDGNSLLAAEYRALESFEARSAPTFRLLVDTAALDEALTSLAPGQSEHPGHPHHADGLEPWLAGEPGLLATSPLAVEDGAVARLLLEPLADPAHEPAAAPEP